MYGYDTVLFPIAKPRVTLPFADRSYQAYRDSPHLGTDLSPWPGACGEPVYAAINGQVLAANLYGNAAGIGNEVILKGTLPYTVWAKNLQNRVVTIPANQPFYLRHGHLATIKVAQGASVRPGKVIGSIGNTGKANGCHLHLELRYPTNAYSDVLDVMDLFVAAIPGLQQQIQYA